MRYACECLDPTCRERFSLTEQQYDRLAEQGAVVSPWCARALGKRVLDRAGDAVAIRTSEAVFAAGRRTR